MDIWDLKNEELENYFQLSNLCLFTSNGHKHGPFGKNLVARERVVIPIDDGNVVAQSIQDFIYPTEDDEPVHYSNSKCFTFCVSFHDKRTRV